jgi:hypothetical protein
VSEEIDRKGLEQAFAAADQPFMLESVATEYDDLPSPLQRLADERGTNDICALMFECYVAEFDDTIVCWMPMKTDELIQGDPKWFAKHLQGVLTAAYNRAIYQREQGIIEKGES